MKLTKVMIEELVGKIEKFLEEKDILNDVCFYFNNKRRSWRWDYEQGKYVVSILVRKYLIRDFMAGTVMFLR